MPTREDFRSYLNRLFGAAELLGFVSVDVTAKNVHIAVGGYPNGGNHRMPVCCEVLREAVTAPGDIVIEQPPQGDGASLRIRYSIPRP
jgi:5-methylcytosine-specific restriction protein A